MGKTWSWFTDNVTASMRSIESAEYGITVNIQDRDDTIATVDGKYSLSQKTEGNGYKVTVMANGSASTGYFKISGPDGSLPLHSTQLAPREVITFTFYPSTTGEYSFESAWGTYSGGNTIKDSDIIGTPKQSEENIDDQEKLEDTEILKDNVDSTPATRPNEKENLDEDINEDSDEEINKDSSGELDGITSTVQPTDDTEETLPHIPYGDNNLEESVEGTFGNTEQNQE